MPTSPNINRVFGLILSRGELVSAVHVLLFRKAGSNLTLQDETHSLKGGKWKFLNVPAGFYDIQFYGRGVTEEAYLYGIEVIDAESPSADIVFSGTPVLLVVEGSGSDDSSFTSFNRTELSTAVFSLTSLQTSAGRIGSVPVYVRQSGSTDYTLLKEFAFDVNHVDTQSDGSAATFKDTIELIQKPSSSFDFRAAFRNPDGEMAATGSAVIYASVNDVVFNGIADFAELPAVTGLSMTNAQSSSGSDAASPSNLPNTGIARLEWDNMKTKATITSHKHADGSFSEVTADEWGLVEAYRVFIFVSAAGNIPDNEFPSSGEGQGTWYFVEETTSTYAEIKVPEDKLFSFFVGATTKGSSSVQTDGLGTLSYTEY